MYPTPLIWLGTWKISKDKALNGYHVWNQKGLWIGVYKTKIRASAEARQL